MYVAFTRRVIGGVLHFGVTQVGTGKQNMQPVPRTIEILRVYRHRRPHRGVDADEELENLVDRLSGCLLVAGVHCPTSIGF